MDKRFVDPRRPKGTPTADEKAEMLPPYDAELPFAANLYASHKEVVEGLKGESLLLLLWCQFTYDHVQVKPPNLLILRLSSAADHTSLSEALCAFLEPHKTHGPC